MIGSHALLLLLRVTIQGAEINITRSLVDPGIRPRRLETLMNDNGGKREEQAVET